MLPKFLGIALAGDPDHETELSRVSGLDSDDSVLDDNRPRRLNAKQLGRCQIGIRSGFPRQVLGMHHVAVDSSLEESI